LAIGLTIPAGAALRVWWDRAVPVPTVTATEMDPVVRDTSSAGMLDSLPMVAGDSAGDTLTVARATPAVSDSLPIAPVTDAPRDPPVVAPVVATASTDLMAPSSAPDLLGAGAAASASEGLTWRAQTRGDSTLLNVLRQSSPAMAAELLISIPDVMVAGLLQRMPGRQAAAIANALPAERRWQVSRILLGMTPLTPDSLAKLSGPDLELPDDFFSAIYR
jgi:hypothetical protein